MNGVNRTKCFTDGCSAPYDTKTFHWCPKCDRVAICITCASDPEIHNNFRCTHEKECSLESYATLKNRAVSVTKKNATKPRPYLELPEAQRNQFHERAHKLSVRLAQLFKKTREKYDAGRGPRGWSKGDTLDVLMLDPGPASLTSVTRKGLSTLINGGWLRSEELNFYLNRNKPEPATKIFLRTADYFTLLLDNGKITKKKDTRQAELVLFPVLIR